MKRLTKEEIIMETANWYSQDTSRRAVGDDGKCHYYLDGKACAFGRCLNSPEDFRNVRGSVKYLQNNAGIDNLEAVLADQYKGHSLEFWKDIQRLHDFKKYWDENGLTWQGSGQVHYLIIKWGDPKVQPES